MFGIMAKNIQDNGKLIKCKEKVFSLGLIKNVIKVNIILFY